MMNWKRSSPFWIKLNRNCCIEKIVLKQKSFKLIALFLFCWLAASNNLFSQQDTLIVSGGTIIKPEKEKKEKKKKKDRVFSPAKASFFSAVFPGMGQIYNRKYWKLPILYGGVGALGYAISFNTKYYRKYMSAYRDFVIQDPNNKTYLEFLPPTWTEEDLQNPQNASWFENALKNKKDYYRRYRDLSVIGMAILYALNIMDASVDAHLSNFDISDDLSMKIEPVLIDPAPSARSGGGVKLSFNF